VWYPGRSHGRAAMRAVTTNHEKSAEAIVAGRRRAESTGVLSTTRKGGMSNGCRKQQRKLLTKE
jgi:hypothetical protein